VELGHFKFRNDTPQEINGVGNLWLYHSKDDEVVPFAHLGRYARKYPWARISAVDKAGHVFSEGAEMVIRDIRALEAK